MFKCFMNRNNSNTMNAAACASVSASACACSENQSAENNKVIMRILDAVFAVSIFVIIDLAVIILNKIIINLLPQSFSRPEMSRA